MPQQNIVPSSDNGLASGATEAAQTSNQNNMSDLKAFAEHLGAMAAYKVMADQSGIPETAGKVVQGSMPGIPTTGIAPLQTKQWQDVPVAGGGLAGEGNRKNFDRATLINTIGRGVTEALNQKKQRDQVAAQRQYEIIMTAMSAMRQQQPGSSEYEHNKNIINDFFSDEKKVKKLEKILGFDAFDAKKEQQKAQDPDYQALQAAASKVSQQGGASSGQMVPDSGATRQPDFNNAMSEKTPLGGTSVNPTGLNPLATKFFGRIPEVPLPPHYIPTPDEVAQSWQVANKIAPDGNQRSQYAMKILDFQKDMGVQVLRNMSDKDVAVIKARADVLGAQIGADRGLQVALLEHGDKLVDQNLKRAELQIQQNRLNFEIDKTNLEKNSKQIEDLVKGYSDARDAAQEQLKLSQQKITALLEAKRAGSKFEDFNAELRAAMNEANDRAAKVDQYSKLNNEIVSKIYGIGFPSNGADTIQRLEQQSKSDGSSGGSPVNKPSNGQNSRGTQSTGTQLVPATGSGVSAPNRPFDYK